MALESSIASHLVARQNEPSILVADCDNSLLQKWKAIVSRHGLALIVSSNKTDIIHSISSPAIKLVILGSLSDSSWDGVELARQLRSLNRKLPLVLIAKENSEDLAIAAFRAGVNDFVKHPCSLEDLVESVNRCLPDYLIKHSEHAITGRASAIVDRYRLVGVSAAMRDIAAAIGKLSSTDVNVLITGETGTGKDLVADLIHKNSPRTNRPFVSINCAAIPDSLLESELFGHERGSFTGAYSSSKGKLKGGEGGTIFLDEIGDMSPHAQSKFLRVIESREVQPIGGRANAHLNVRFIAATNRNLEQAVAEKTFRKDLYYRLNVANIHMPQLKDRKEDIPSLCKYYIETFNLRFGRQVEGFTEDAVESLFRYDWPGNVRELRNLLEVTIGNMDNRKITMTDFPEQFRRRLHGSIPFSRDERYPLLSVLNATNWNISKAAQKLNWSRMTIYRKMAKYHIHRNGDGDIKVMQSGHIT